MSKKTTTKLLREENSSQLISANHLSNNADSFLSKDMIRYIEHAVDPKSAPCHPRPAPASQYVGLVQKVPILARGEVSVGANGFGSIVVDPDTCLACSDRVLGCITDASYTGVSSTQIPVGAATGSAIFYPSKAPFVGGGLGANSGDQLNVLINACGLYVKPIGSATTQNGRLFLLEVPSHPTSTASVTYSDVMNHPRTRVIDAVQLGTPGFQNVLNWHPQTGVPILPENWFTPPSAASNHVGKYSLVVVFAGDAGTKYEFEVYSSFLARGELANPSTPCYTDPLGWAAYLNLIADKRVSGWVGSAGVASALYKGFTAHHVRRMQPKAIRKEEEARALLDAKKAEKLSKPAPMSWWQHIKKAAPLAKEIGGFLLNMI